MTNEISLTLSLSPDTEDGLVRMDPSDMRLMGVSPGAAVVLSGPRTSYARVQPAAMENRNQGLVTGSPLLFGNLQANPGARLSIAPYREEPSLAESIVLQVDDDIDRRHLAARVRNLSIRWQGRILVAKDWLGVPSLDRNPLLAQVMETRPGGVVYISHGTRFSLFASKPEDRFPGLAGLRDVYRTCQALAVEALQKKTVGTARSILLSGPSGCGKARLVARLAEETGVPLHVLDMHHLLDRQLLDYSAETGLFLSEIVRRGPAILLLDHLEVLSQAATATTHAVLAKVAALFEEARLHADLMTFGVVSGVLPDRFRDHTRFDLVLPVDLPDRFERQEILSLAVQEAALEGQVDVAQLAAMTPGVSARKLFGLVTMAANLSRLPAAGPGEMVSAIRQIEPADFGGVRCDLPDMPWHDVAGLDETKQLVHDTLLWSLRYSDRFSLSGIQPPRSLLLSGGPGTGKTSLVRAMASAIPLHFIELNCNTLMMRDADAAAQAVRDGFVLARRKTPCLVFLDDIDALFEARPDTVDAAHLHHPAVTRLLYELDGIELVPGVAVIAATSRPDRLTMDVLTPGHFDFAVTLPMPDAAARAKILQIHARKLPLAGDVDFEHLAGLTQGFSPADLAGLCNRVGLMAMRQSMQAEGGGVIPPMVNAALFEQALRGRKG